MPPDEREDQEGLEASEQRSPAGLTYSASGVDLERGSQAKRRIQELARSTFDSCVVQDIGAFAGLYRPDLGGLQRPVLVSSADGVGTKLKVAMMAGVHNTVGVDLVAHCCNDILALGARPLFFLDYLAAGRIEPEVMAQVVEGLAAECGRNGCVLLGGETAEMPDFYQPGEYDLAGFIVGIADEANLKRPESVREGDVLLGLPSSGLHTNGYSLVRRLFFKRLQLTVDSYVPELQRTVGEELLIPHLSYWPALGTILSDSSLHAIAHITGGGVTKNLDRALPPSLDAEVECCWEVPAIFSFIQERGKVEQAEMLRTFNMGIGMILVVAAERAESLQSELESQGHACLPIGRVVSGQGEVVYR